MSVSISGTAITFPDSTTQNTGGYTGFRNRIINGDMRIDQRNNGAAVTTDGGFPVDRWMTFQVNTTYTGQRSTVVPSGFTNSLGFTITTARTPAATDYYYFRQSIEGFNVADLGWGTAFAGAVTLSFKVRSSVTGTFSGSLQNAAQNRSYVFTFNVSSANTWTDVVLTIPGDTSGTWAVNNTAGLRVNFDLGMGSNFVGAAGSWLGSSAFKAAGTVNIVGTNGATFYITGVQLEKGSVATPFEFRPYGTELQLCQRYFCKTMDQGTALGNGLPGGTNGYIYVSPVTTTQKLYVTWKFPVTMRANPTVTTYGYAGAASNTWRNTDNNINGPTIASFNAGQEMTGLMGDGTATAWSTGMSYVGAAAASAEL